MTKLELIAAVAQRTGIDKAEVAATVEALMATVKESLINDGESVFLRGFGTFTLKQRAAATGRDLQRNTTIDIPAHDIPYFRPCATFKAAVATQNKKKTYNK